MRLHKLNTLNNISIINGINNTNIFFIIIPSAVVKILAKNLI